MVVLWAAPRAPMTALDLAFVQPPGRDRITGGNPDVEGLTGALAAVVPLRLVDADRWDADAAAAPWPTLYLVDGLCLPAIERFAPPPAAEHRVVLVAHLLPGLDSAHLDPD